MSTIENYLKELEQQLGQFNAAAKQYQAALLTMKGILIDVSDDFDYIKDLLPIEDQKIAKSYIYSASDFLLDGDAQTSSEILTTVHSLISDTE